MDLHDQSLLMLMVPRATKEQTRRHCVSSCLTMTELQISACTYSWHPGSTGSCI